MHKRTKQQLNILAYVLTGLLVLLAVLLAGVRFWDLQTVSIPAGSRDSLYHAGTLVYVKETRHTVLKEGDNIAFRNADGTVSVQQILQVASDPLEPWVMHYRTGMPGTPAEAGTVVYYKNIIGIPVFGLPGLGSLAESLWKPAGKFLLVLGCIGLTALLLIPDQLPDKKPRRRRPPAAVAAATQDRAAAPDAPAPRRSRSSLPPKKPAPQKRGKYER